MSNEKMFIRDVCLKHDDKSNNFPNCWTVMTMMNFGQWCIYFAMCT